MKPIIPEIQVGRKYLLRIRETEAFCPHCGIHVGAGHSGEEHLVIVRRPTTPILECYNCLQLYPCPEGMWTVENLVGEQKGYYRAVPYTQLHEIEEEKLISRWTHALCLACYGYLEPGRRPVKLKAAEMETCCRCGQQTQDGIYYRAAPFDYCQHKEEEKK